MKYHVPPSDSTAWRAYADAAKPDAERILLFLGLRCAEGIDFSAYFESAGGLISNARPERLCLSLPETPSRRGAFEAIDLNGFRVIDGLKCHPGWRGAALTYRQIARTALALNRSHLLICQDDMEPLPSFDQHLSIIGEYMRQSGADMFAALVSDVDDSFVLRRVVRYRGLTFLHLNKSVGLVCNIFGARALDHLSRWPDNGRRGPVIRTIDRYMAAAQGVDVVTCLPFVVGHRGSESSTIWGFNNARYDTLIAYSMRRLTEMANRFPQR